MFPVYTGINRDRACSLVVSINVPCIHRDKPASASASASASACSLYTQG